MLFGVPGLGFYSICKLYNPDLGGPGFLELEVGDVVLQNDFLKRTFMTVTYSRSFLREVTDGG